MSPLTLNTVLKKLYVLGFNDKKMPSNNKLKEIIDGEMGPDYQISPVVLKRLDIHLEDYITNKYPTLTKDEVH